MAREWNKNPKYKIFSFAKTKRKYTGFMIAVFGVIYQDLSKELSVGQRDKKVAMYY
jgi:hypothetical protein